MRARSVPSRRRFRNRDARPEHEHVVTLTNTGTAAVHVKLGEQAGGFQIAGKPASTAYQRARRCSA